jgi:hypothetical protein
VNTTTPGAATPSFTSRTLTNPSISVDPSVFYRKKQKSRNP